MKYHELTIVAHTQAKRVGRGIAAGQGKTAGRGTKGQNSRTGSSRKPGFEGGQNPLMQRLPKLHGFTSHKPAVELIYTAQLNALSVKLVDSEVLVEHGLIADAHGLVKLLAKGELSKKLTVKLPAASATAISAIEQAGGTFEKTPQLQRKSPPSKTSKP